MAWYNPWSWGKQKPSEEINLIVGPNASSGVGTTEIISREKGSAGKILYLSTSISGGGRAPAPTPSSTTLSTTEDTGTGYNPATKTNIPAKPPTAEQIRNLPSATNLALAGIGAEIGKSAFEVTPVDVAKYNFYGGNIPPEILGKDLTSSTSKNAGGVVSAYNPSTFAGEGYKQSFSESILQSARNIFKFGTIGEKGFGAYASGIIAPLKYSGGVTYGHYTSQQLSMLRAAEVTTPYLDKDILVAYRPGITRGEFQKNIIDVKEVPYIQQYNKEVSNIQNQINAGTLSFKEGQNLLSLKVTPINAAYSKDVSKYLSSVSTTGEKIGKAAQIYATTGAIIGASSFGGPLGQTIISGYFIGKSIGTTVNLESSWSDLTTFEKAKGTGLIALYGGAGLYGFSGAISSIRQDILTSDIQGVINLKPQLRIGYRQNLDEGFVKDITASYKSYGETQMIETTESILKQTENNYFLVGGRGQATISAVEMGTGRNVMLATGSRFVGGGMVLPGGTQGWVPSLISGKTGTTWDLYAKETGKQLTYGQGILKASLGKKVYGNLNLYSQPVNTKSLRIAGISKQSENILYSISGKNPIPTPSGFSFNAQDYTALKIINPETAGGSIVIKGGTVPSVSSAGNIVNNQVSKQLTSSISKLSSSVSSAEIPRSIISGVSSRLVSTILAGIENQKLSTATSLSQGLQTKELTKNIPSGIVVGGLSVESLTRQTSATSLFQPQLQPQKLQQITSNPLVAPPASPVLSPAFNPPPLSSNFPLIPPWFPKLDFNFGAKQVRFRKRQRRKYLPSFEALVFGIKGKAPKGIETGFRVRPIPKGYSFAFKSSPIKIRNFGSNFSKGFAFQPFNINTLFGKTKRRKKRR